MAGLMQPMGMYLVFRIFPADRRGQVMGIYGMGVILAPALGPVLGGFLVDQFNWRYVMFAPAPVTLLGVWMAWRFLPLPRSRPAHYPFDLTGLLLLGATIALTLDTLTRMQAWPGQEQRIVMQWVLSLGLLIAFVFRERTAKHPLVNLVLLRQPVFLFATLGAMALGLALFGSTDSSVCSDHTGLFGHGGRLADAARRGSVRHGFSPVGPAGRQTQRSQPGAVRDRVFCPVCGAVCPDWSTFWIWLVGVLGGAGPGGHRLHVAGPVHRCA
jgi:MFS family permease